jgi:structure-specific recognition protein 1
MQFLKDEDLELTMNVESDQLAGKFDGKLRHHYDAPIYEVVSNVLQAVSGQPLITAHTFSSHYNAAGLKCSMKANEGLLYPLQEQLVFIPKPTLVMPYSDIASVTFMRINGGGVGASSGRTFDLKVSLKRGGEVVFGGLNKEEFGPLEAYLKANGRCRVKTEIPPEVAYLNQTSSSESEQSDDEEDRGARKKSRLDGGAAKPGANGGGDDDDEDESEDEDFKPGDESDVAEEFDEEYDSSGSESGEGGTGDDDDDEEEEDD